MKKLFVTISAIVLLSGCAVAPFQPPTGALFSDVKAPLQIDHNNTYVGKRVGKSSALSIFGLIAVGDASVQKAAREGRISTITHTDYEFMNVLFGLFTRTTVYVYGE